MRLRFAKFGKIRENIKSTSSRKINNTSTKERIANNTSFSRKLTSTSNLSIKKKILAAQKLAKTLPSLKQKEPAKPSIKKKIKQISRPPLVNEHISKTKINPINNLHDLISQKKQLIHNHIEWIWTEYNKKRLAKDKRISTTIIYETLKAKELLKETEPLEIKVTSHYDVEIEELKKELKEYEENPERIVFKIKKEEAKIRDLDEKIKKINLQSIIDERNILHNELTVLSKLNQEHHHLRDEFTKQKYVRDGKLNVIALLKEKLDSICKEHKVTGRLKIALNSLVDNYTVKYFKQDIINHMKYRNQRIDELDLKYSQKEHELKPLLFEKENIEKNINYQKKHLPVHQRIVKKYEIRREIDDLEGLRRREINQIKVEKTNEQIYSQKLDQARKLAKIENRLYKLINYIKK